MILRFKMMQKLVDLVLPGHSIVYPPYDLLERHGDRHVVSCGSGPEMCAAGISDNPNWHWNKAANAVALARWLERHGA